MLHVQSQFPQCLSLFFPLQFFSSSSNYIVYLTCKIEHIDAQTNKIRNGFFEAPSKATTQIPEIQVYDQLCRLMIINWVQMYFFLSQSCLYFLNF
jgi:hypothetical protein